MTTAFFLVKVNYIEIDKIGYVKNNKTLFNQYIATYKNKQNKKPEFINFVATIKIGRFLLKKFFRT